MRLKKLKGANMDIDLINNKKNFLKNSLGFSTSSQSGNKASNSVENKKINWKQDKCPWSSDDKQEHKCAEKNICVCDFFQGIEEPDVVLCSYGEKI